MLTLEQVGKSYDTRSGPLPVLRDVNLTLERGQAAVVMGPSGSGKSTLLNILGTLDTPTTGRVGIDGVDPSTLGELELARFRATRIGFIFQDHHVLPQCSVLENVLVPALADPLGRDRLPRAKQLLERVGLLDRLDHRPSEISGGQRQRVAIARALVNEPGLVLADEPTGNLDRATAEGVASLLAELVRDENVALVMVTHDARLAGRFGDVYELNDGTLTGGQLAK
jgi:lipoprotein-releasing system ATP-binding protein